jgi:hypothetical protein
MVSTSDSDSDNLSSNLSRTSILPNTGPLLNNTRRFYTFTYRVTFPYKLYAQGCWKLRVLGNGDFSSTAPFTSKLSQAAVPVHCKAWKLLVSKEDKTRQDTSRLYFSVTEIDLKIVLKQTSNSIFCPEWGSNSRPRDYETRALPTALSRPWNLVFSKITVTTLFFLVMIPLRACQESNLESPDP